MIWPCPETALVIAQEGLWELVQQAPGSGPDLPHHILEGSILQGPWGLFIHRSLPAQ